MKALAQSRDLLLKRGTRRLLLGLWLTCWSIGSLTYADELTPTQAAQATEIQCNNLVYALGKTSVCFADHFLTTAAQQTSLPISKQFHAVQLGSDKVFDSPFTVISGNGSFRFTDQERKNLRQYLTCGGFLLASPGCSDSAWDASFRSELKQILPEAQIKKIPMSHPLFSTVYRIPTLNLKSGGTTLVEGIELNGRIVMIHSAEGLNDAHHASGCCCCGGNQILESEHVNVNILLYALLN